jgi:nicotinamidase-related amidase
MNDTILDPATSALLSMDLQGGIVAAYAADRPDLLGRVASVLDCARGAGMAVIHVKVGFRPGLPEVSSRNVLFSSIKKPAAVRRCFGREVDRIYDVMSVEHGFVITRVISVLNQGAARRGVATDDGASPRG